MGLRPTRGNENRVGSLVCGLAGVERRGHSGHCWTGADSQAPKHPRAALTVPLYHCVTVDLSGNYIRRCERRKAGR